jgi:hypothetical protein
MDERGTAGNGFRKKGLSRGYNCNSGGPNKQQTTSHIIKEMDSEEGSQDNFGMEEKILRSLRGKNSSAR